MKPIISFIWLLFFTLIQSRYLQEVSTHTAFNEETNDNENKTSEDVEDKKEESEEKILTEEEAKKVFSLPVVFEDDENFYIGALGIGTPRQYFPVQIDTTSSITWIPSEECNNCKSLTRFVSNESSTLIPQDNDTNTEHHYIHWFDNDGAIEGQVVQDEVQFAELVIPNYKFVKGTEWEHGFHDYEDGKLGIGFKDPYKVKHERNETGFMEYLKDKGIIDKIIFTIKEINDTNGEIIIGDFVDTLLNETREINNDNSYNYTSCKLIDMEELHPDDKESWVCKLTHIIINNTIDNINDNKNEEEKHKTELNKTILFETAMELNDFASFDTGSSYIYAPKHLDKQFKEQFLDKFFNTMFKEKNDERNHIISYVSSNKTEFLEALDINKNLTFTFVIDGIGYIIPIDKLFEINEEEEEIEFNIKFAERGNIWKLGYPFLKEFIVIFNKEIPEIGIITNNYINYSFEVKTWESSLFREFIIKVTIIAVGIIVFLWIVFIIFLFYRGIRKSQARDDKKNLVENENK